MHVIHTYISHCFVFEVSDLCIALVLTSYATIADFDAWTHNFYNSSLASCYSMPVQTFIHCQFCLKVHSTAVKALHEIGDMSCMFY